MAKAVGFTREDAKRIGNVVRAAERAGATGVGDYHPFMGDDADPVRLGKTTAAWNKGTLATIDLYEDGTPPNETKKAPVETLEDCVNKFADVKADKWVIVARAGNGRWYLISAEC